MKKKFPSTTRFIISPLIFILSFILPGNAGVADPQISIITDQSPGLVYEAIIPGEAIKSKWDIMYLIEIMDLKNHGIIYPDLSKETPYVVVKVSH